MTPLQRIAHGLVEACFTIVAFVWETFMLLFMGCSIALLYLAAFGIFVSFCRQLVEPKRYSCGPTRANATAAPASSCSRWKILPRASCVPGRLDD